MSRLDRFRDCGRKAIAGAVTLKTGPAAAGWDGIATCGSVHVCPVCAPKVRRARAEELDRVGTAWESVDLAGGTARGLILVTLTMRHFARQSLSLLVQRQREAWKRAFGQNALRTTKRIRRALGVIGYVRAWETTHGEANGWHAHYHVAVFLEERPDTRRVALLERLIYGAWADALEKVGAYRPSREHGVRVDAPGVGEAGQIARYLMKGQDGKWGAAQELVRSDAKAGRRGHRMPMEIARGAVGGDARDGELWREYEETATGLRALYWSQGLRGRLAELADLDERQDDEIAAESDAKTPAAHFPLRTWYGHVVNHPGRRLQLTHAAERWSVPGIRTLVESWGLLWGVDVLAPEQLPASGTPTAAEVLAQMERAEVAARAEVWRRELERQEREERLSRVAYQPSAWEERAEAQADEDRSRTRALSTAEKRQEAYRAALRRAKAKRPAEELQSAMRRFRAA